MLRDPHVFPCKLSGVGKVFASTDRQWGRTRSLLDIPESFIEVGGWTQFMCDVVMFGIVDVIPSFV